MRDEHRMGSGAHWSHQVTGQNGLPQDRPARKAWQIGLVRTGPYTRSGKNRAISRPADSWESDPWTRFSLVSMARSPRIVPGSASAELVTPMRVRTTAKVSL